MTGTDPYEDPEGIALVEGILERVGYRGADSPAPMADLGPAVELARDVARAGRLLAPILGFELAVEQLVSLVRSGAIQPVRPAASVARINKRHAALAAKQRSGKGPPSSSSWRGRERTTKYRSQS